VEQKTGLFNVSGSDIELIDLPGVYSLEKTSHSGLDEQVARDYLKNAHIDLLINIVDATSLERQLFLTSQLLHMGLPMIVVVNRVDLLPQRNLDIDFDKLSEKLQCPVIPVSAYDKAGINKIKHSLPNYVHQPIHLKHCLPDALKDAVHNTQSLLDERFPTCWKTLQRLLDPSGLGQAHQSAIADQKRQLETEFGEELSLVIADMYFQFAHEASHYATTETKKLTRHTTDKIDYWTLHPVWGIPIFLFVMYFLFAASIALGNLFLDFFDLAAQALFVDQPTVWLQAANAPEWLIAVIANGIGGGIQVVATFIPIIGALFLLLTTLEETGYMQRAALIMDRGMRKIGLSGQAFVPLVVGLGCNVPAVMAARTVPDKRDRIMTTMMTPFMSCSARLPVYVLFASAFFHDHAALLVFSLYLVGIISAIVTAIILKKTLLPGESPPLFMELPSYHKPALINVVQNTKHKMKGFIIDAGKVIVIVVLILNFFNSLGTDGSFGNENQPNSVLSTAAKSITPVVEPLGITEENWPATVGLITGLLAKEVVIGALDALYNIDSEEDQTAYSFTASMQEALVTIPDNVVALHDTLLDPVGLSSVSSADSADETVKSLEISQSTLSQMTHYFANEVSAYAYLLLVLLYFPCVATLGAIRKELGRRWMYTSGLWSLFLGYTLSVGFYQAMTFSEHPISSLYWLIGIGLSYLGLFALLTYQGRKNRPNPPLFQEPT